VTSAVATVPPTEWGPRPLRAGVRGRTPNGRTLAQALADHHIREMRRRWADLTRDARREIAAAKRMLRQGERRALIRFARNAGKPGSRSLGKFYGWSLCVLEGWL